MHKLAVTSGVAAIMSFAYSGIGLSLSVAKLVSNGVIKGSIAGNSLYSGESSLTTKLWNSFQALGNIGIAYAFSPVLLEIQVQRFVSKLLKNCVRNFMAMVRNVDANISR
ncbi:hypothetical protein AMTR_s00071p00165090 [Amborella trichopoda]|uniref:Amino acid transporter transmembrane domain-containing protein n=1 Tax=Amborella trichopoda TaxID=13333 RepID=U5D365_AMBTC|nr:hypothetical protein AMTR_s00071p00165090 [Amborella trichopoda]